MDASNSRTARFALWCGMLEADYRPVLPAGDVRTVRGLYSAARAPRRKRDDSTAEPLDRTRSVDQAP